MRVHAAAAVAFGLCLVSSPAAAVTLDFETEDDFVTPLINGQIVDPAFDGADLEFGNIVNVSSTQLGTAGHLGVTVFDSTPSGPNDPGPDPDLLVGLGNVLILQNDATPGTSVDGSVGLIYDTPNDEKDFADRGAIVFDFLSPVFMQSIDIIDANGGYLADVVLIDSGGDSRTYSVPSMWTFDISVCGASCPPGDGWDTLDLTSLLPQVGEGGPSTSVLEDAGFTASDVVRLEVQLVGSPSSGGIDNLSFTVPEPSTGVLLLAGLLLAMRRREKLR
jgi:hypothetical protein